MLSTHLLRVARILPENSKIWPRRPNQHLLKRSKLMKITSAFLFIFLLLGSATQARIRVKLAWDHDQACSSHYVVQVSDQSAIRYRDHWSTLASIDWLPSESNPLVIDLPDRAVNYVVSYAVCQNGQWSQPSNILKVLRHQIQASSSTEQSARR